MGGRLTGRRPPLPATISLLKSDEKICNESPTSYNVEVNSAAELLPFILFSAYKYYRNVVEIL